MTSPVSNRSVLVVEDEMMVAWMLGAMLVDLGYTVVGTAARVDQALKMIETLPMIDAVVLDITLNGQKSYPVADALIARGIPFVFSTGYNKDNLPEIYQSLPILQKPYGDSELAAALIKLLPPGDSEQPTSPIPAVL